MTFKVLQRRRTSRLLRQKRTWERCNMISSTEWIESSPTSRATSLCGIRCPKNRVKRRALVLACRLERLVLRPRPPFFNSQHAAVVGQVRKERRIVIDNHDRFIRILFAPFEFGRASCREG